MTFLLVLMMSLFGHANSEVTREQAEEMVTKTYKKFLDWKQIPSDRYSFLFNGRDNNFWSSERRTTWSFFLESQSTQTYLRCGGMIVDTNSEDRVFFVQLDYCSVVIAKFMAKLKNLSPEEQSTYRRFESMLDKETRWKPAGIKNRFQLNLSYCYHLKEEKIQEVECPPYDNSFF